MLWRSDHVPVPAGEALRTESGRDGPHPQSGGKETVREHSETQERTAHQRKITGMPAEVFSKVPVKPGKKKRVGITGEIYMKCSKLGNDDIESFLLRQEWSLTAVVSSTTVCIWWIQERYKVEKYQHNPIMAKACAFVLHRLCEAQKHLLTVIGETDRFQTDLPFPELKEKVQGILAEGCNTGDGWLIAAEVIQYVEKGCGVC